MFQLTSSSPVSSVFSGSHAHVAVKAINSVRLSAALGGVESAVLVSSYRTPVLSSFRLIPSGIY